MAYDKQKARSEYSQKLRDPRWQKQRLRILERDEFTCQHCFDSESTLNVHHKDYVYGKDPWDYPDEWLVTFCETCHQEETESRPAEEKALLKVLRVKGYSASDLNELLIAFDQGPDAYDPMPSVLAWMISNRDAWHDYREAYFEHLKQKSEAYKQRQKAEADTAKQEVAD